MLFAIGLVLAVQILLLSAPLAVGENSRIIWDVAEEGRFDPTYQGYSVDNDRVVVDLDGEKSLCPVGFFSPAKGRDRVREVVFRYRVAQPGCYWLHIIWDPGGSGKEQFEVLFNGEPVGTSQLIDGRKTPNQETTERFPLEHESGRNEIELRYLSGNGLRFHDFFLSTEEKPPVRVKPNAEEPPARVKPTTKFPTITDLASYEKEIREPGVYIDSDHVGFYAPKRREKEAGIVHGYLVRAYDELYKIVGMHTKNKIIVYALRRDSPYGPRLGRAAGGKIWYDYQNIEFESQPEWTQHRVPHVSGYIEEMAHIFVGPSLATFGNEAVGWSFSRIVAGKVADNPIYRKNLEKARETQAKTFIRYIMLGHTFPKDIPANYCDRIHVHLLHQCEQQYGPQFWPDFFTEIRESRDALLAANESGPFDERRNARYRITIDCFDRVMGGKFKKMLQDAGISLTTDVLSLHFKDPDWDRHLETPSERTARLQPAGP